MKRYQHSWRQTAADQYPTQYICVDCDASTERISSRPLAERENLTRWVAHSRRLSAGSVVRTGVSTGATAAEWWQRLDSFLAAGTTTWLFMANAGRVLSLLGFWKELEAQRLVPIGGNSHDGGSADGRGGKDSFGCVIIEDPPTILVLSRGKANGTIKVVDLRNYGPEISCWQGDADERSCRQAEWVARALAVLRLNNLGSWRCTAGAQAVYSLRRRLMPVAPYVHNFGSFLRLERDCYHGGRCEAYWIGEIAGPVYHLDVRNLYPWCGWHHDLPHLPGRMYVEPSCEEASKLALSALCLGDVTVRTGRADYPVVAELSAGDAPRPVPLHERRFTGVSRGNTIYPSGIMRTCLAGPELRDAIIHGLVERFHRLATYHGANLFAPFYATWYSLLEKARKEDDVPTQQWIKRVMVALVGKLAETGKTWLPGNADPSHGPWSDWRELGTDGVERRYRNVAWYTQREEVSAESGESCPALAAWITSLARVRLLHLMRIAGSEHVYYCDTDAILCDRHGYDSLVLLDEVRPDTVGHLRLLGVHKRAVVYGVKHYSLDGVYKCAGLPRGTVTESSDPGLGWYRRPLADAAKDGRAPESVDVLLGYARRHGYKHGRVMDDGRVVPWKMGEV